MTIYVEGGGDTRNLQAGARKGFSKLVEAAGLKDRMPRIVACGSRTQTFHDFSIAVKNGDKVALLVDSEDPVSADSTAAAHLKKRDNWSITGVEDEIHLMVQVMEAWFLTQPGVLFQYFGSDFSAKALPKGSALENIGKSEIAAGLDKASRGCSNGPYSARKRQGFEILERLDPKLIEQASPFAKRFFDYLRQQCN